MSEAFTDYEAYYNISQATHTEQPSSAAMAGTTASASPSTGPTTPSSPDAAAIIVDSSSSPRVKVETKIQPELESTTFSPSESVTETSTSLNVLGQTEVIKTAQSATPLAEPNTTAANTSSILHAFSMDDTSNSATTDTQTTITPKNLKPVEPYTAVETAVNDDKFPRSTPESSQSSVTASNLTAGDIGGMVASGSSLQTLVLAAKANIGGLTTSDEYLTINPATAEDVRNLTEDMIVAMGTRLHNAILHPFESCEDKFVTAEELAKHKASQETALERCKRLLTKNEWAQNSAKSRALLAVVHAKEIHVQGIPLRFLDIVQGKETARYRIDTIDIDRALTCTQRIDKMIDCV